jgi:hypothetical protein
MLYLAQRSRFQANFASQIDAKELGQQPRYVLYLQIGFFTL